ncbi:MAG: monovalent cation/H(+) antiporter subunit G [Candidatus Omnitrophota bacterium]
MNEILGVIFIVVGLAFNIFGCLGLIRFPDVYNRLQATTKCVTVGTCSILIGVLIMKGFCATGVKALLTALFLLLTSPVAAHALARGAHKAGVKLWEKSVCDQYAEDKEGKV